MSEEEDAKARERQRVILEVLSGRMTATEAAGTLRVSRKTYYEWQDRGLSAMQKDLPKPVPFAPAPEGTIRTGGF